MTSQEERERMREEDRLIAEGIAGYRVYQSRFTELYVLSLRDKYGFPPNFSVRAPSVKECPNNLPVGYLCFYVIQLDVGLHFLALPSTLKWLACLMSLQTS